MDKRLLESIFQKVNEIIETANPKDFPHDAINWGDLGCCEVGYVVSYDGFNHLNPYYSILIDEASPDAANFCEYIQDELEKAGYNAIFEVRTEW